MRHSSRSVPDRAFRAKVVTVRRLQVKVVLGEPGDQPGDLIVLPARRNGARDPRTALVRAPRWQVSGGSEVRLAEAYRSALAEANARNAETLVLPAMLVLTAWPIEELIRVAMTVLMSTPTTVSQVTIAAPMPALVEAWAEGVLREP